MNVLTNAVLKKMRKPVTDERIIDFLDAVSNDVKAKNIEVTEYLKVIMTMLVAQLVLYYKALDNINEAEDVSSKDNYNRKAKAPEISVMQKSHDKILEMLDKISLSPLAAAKIKKLNSIDSSANEADPGLELLNTLKG